MPIEIEAQQFRSSREIEKEREGIRLARERVLKVNIFFCTMKVHCELSSFTYLRQFVEYFNKYYQEHII